MMKLSVALSIVTLALAASRGEAQGRGQDKEQRETKIPVASRPPAGMCRVWLDGVPAAQQPAPTDCASAVRNRPAKGRVIFGDDYVRKAKPADTTRGRFPIKGFTQPPRKP